MVRVVTAAVRPTQLGALLFVIGLVGGMGWFVLSSRPALNHARAGYAALGASEHAMYAEQNALLNYLDTSDPTFLSSYNAAVRDADAANTTASGAFRASGDVVVNSMFAQSWTAAQAWISQWAIPVSSGSWKRLADASGNAAPTPAERAAFNAEGTRLFESYEQRQHGVMQIADSHVSATLNDQYDEDLYFDIGVLVLGAVAVTGLVIGRRRIQARVVEPIQHLVAEADRVASGDYSPIDAHTDTSVREVSELMTSLQHMTTSLVAQRDAADQRAAELLDRTQRQQRLIELSRDLSASLSMRSVVTSLSKSLRILANAETAELWVQSWDNLTLTKYALDDTQTEETARIGNGLVGRAAQYARKLPLDERTVDDDSVDCGWAIPLVIGAKVVGVLVARPRPGLSLGWEMVDALTLQGAAALQAAIMHSEAEEQARRDPLTGLANRRQLTLDLAREVERAHRFDHALAFVMLDLDHFKRLNDSYGHPRGDDVLKGVADLIVREVRSVDTAYRYGGEELAILMRQANGDEAVATAERLRLLVSGEFGWARESPVSFSAGVAELRGPNETARDLIAAADAALYAAKNAGRDRVVLFPFDEDRRVG